MQPSSPILTSYESEPNVELLRRMGSSIGPYFGAYCMAWRGSDEVTFEWRYDGWHRVGGRGGVDEL